MGDAAAAAPLGKRRRADEAAGLRRVAEIVMVLATAGQVRGGREPTAAERALAAEARERLATAVAEGAVRPKDLFPGEVVRAVVEDLGLNRAKDPAAMGFRPPKASIADRLMLTKRKMEEVKEAPAQPTVSTPHTVVSGGMSDFHGLNVASKIGVGVPRNQPAVAALTASAPLTSVSPVILKPPGSSPVKQVANSVVGLHYTGPSHLNGPLNLARGAATIVHSNKSTLDTSTRSNVNAVQSSSHVVKNQGTKPVAVQAATGSTVTGHRATPGVAFVQPKPTFANHNEIAKIVQQFLHQPANHPSWTPPSTEYMHSRLGCQICKVAITDADSLLICDACERGVHLKCLQQYGNKGVPKAEWHCSACLTQSKGKPLPPKYGKVTRTVVATKAASPPSGDGAQLCLQGSAENMAAKENHQKLVANGNLMKPIFTQAGSSVHNINILALSAITAASQSHLVSTLRPSIGNAIKSETSSHEREGTGQPCSSMIHHDIKSPLNKRLNSGFSLNSEDSVNDTMNSEQTAEISGAEVIKYEANYEPPASRDEEMVDRSVTSIEQTKTVATEEEFSEQSTFKADKMKDGETTTNAGTPIDQGSNFVTEEKLCSEATSEPHTINDSEMVTNAGTPIDQGSNFVTEEKLCSEATSEPHTINDSEMTTDTGIPIQQSNSSVIEEKLQIDAASELHTIQDMEMGTNDGPPVDQNSKLDTEHKLQSETTSSLGDVYVTTNVGIPTDQTQHSNGSAENGLIKPPNGEAYKDNSSCNAVSDHACTQKVTSNGILHPKDETSLVHENEAVGFTAEVREAN